MLTLPTAQGDHPAAVSGREPDRLTVLSQNHRRVRMMTIAGAVRTFGVVTALAFAVATPYKRVVAQHSSSVQSSDEGKITDGLQLLIDTEKDVFVQDEPIVLNFHWKNFRQQAVDTITHALNAYSVELTDGSGRHILSKEEERRKELESTGEVSFKYAGSHSYIKIDPGGEQKSSLDLRKAYSLLPGTTYSIRAKRNVEKSDENGVVTVVSNTITVTVLQ